MILMFVVRVIDIAVRIVQYLVSPAGRMVRTGLTVVVAGAAIVGVTGLLWALAQLPLLFGDPNLSAH